MNYLAHIFLSGSDRKCQIGNYVADAVKGKSYEDYPEKIAAGILFHRAIDDYTDTHPLVRSMVNDLKPQFGRYSAILLDMYFDYLLASRFDHFSKVPLKRFARRFYVSLILNYSYLPPRFKSFMWHFIVTNRLNKYARQEGLKESLEIMVKYRNLNISVDASMAYLSLNEDALFDQFLLFFDDLQNFSKNYICTNLSR